ncbi:MULTISPECIES: hypothetical protein [unclassified Pseudomonas]|uniref:hypothetical protein n=1 Tax=unclassified Pseudomonas TaxID=196821 RepID=UPI0030D9BE20
MSPVIGRFQTFLIQTINLNLKAAPLFDMRAHLRQSARPLIRPPSSLYVGCRPMAARAQACQLFTFFA